MNQAPQKPMQEPWDAHLQALHQQFLASASDQCLLWVNQAQGDPFQDNPIAQARKVIISIEHPRFDLTFAPYLLPLDLSTFADADIFKTSVQIAWEDWTMPNLLAFGGQTIAGWVMTDDTPKALAKYWARYCHIHRVNKLEKLLRFHDPSVREWLWPTLSEAQQQQLLGPAKSVIAFSRHQTLMNHSVELPLKTSNKASPKKLSLSAEQWSQIEDYATVHSAWLDYCTAQPALSAALKQTPHWEQGILRALQQATHYGLHDTQDRALFALHALQLGKEFYQHPKLKAVWLKTQTGDDYNTALEEVLGKPADQLHTLIAKQ